MAEVEHHYVMISCPILSNYSKVEVVPMHCTLAYAQPFKQTDPADLKYC